jgi:predicted CXXCH cytochrome family protein
MRLGTYGRAGRAWCLFAGLFLGTGLFGCLGLWAASRVPPADPAAVPNRATAGTPTGRGRAPALTDSPRLAAELPMPRAGDSYVGSGACRSCHVDEHASWHRSHHRTMTQVAEPGKVAGAFDGTTVMSEGLAYRIFRQGDGYYAEMPDPDVMMYVVQGGRKLAHDRIPRVTVPVVMSTGSHHYQTYWVASPRYDRLLQTLPLVYLIGEGRWIPRETAFMRGPNDKERFVTQWNHHCIRCHSTGGNPGLDDASGMLKSEVGELGISCEACHGPGGDHVRFQSAIASRAVAARPPAGGTSAANEAKAPMREDRTIVNPARLDARRSSQVCGQCHGVYIMHDEFAMDAGRMGPLYRPGDDLERTRYYIRHPANDPSPARKADLARNPDFFRERWWDDGTILAGGREYSAMTASKCFESGGMSCLTCHSMHGSDPDDQLKAGVEEGRVCVQCHREPKYSTELSKHTFHASESSGSRCVNCHMPHTTYALLKGIRSHQIASPSIRSSAQTGTPNACNLCHLDRTLGWASEQMTRWYGSKPVELTAEQREVSAALLWLLKGHAAQRVIAAWHMGWEPALAVSGSDWQAPFQAQLLSDSYGVVRYVADRGLRQLPGFADRTYDFLAATNVLAGEVDRVRAAWEARGGGRARVERGRGRELLIGADGTLDRTRLGELLRTRDPRPVTIKE